MTEGLGMNPEDYFDKVLFGRIGICWHTYLWDSITFKGRWSYGSNWSRWNRKFLGIYWRQL